MFPMMLSAIESPEDHDIITAFFIQNKNFLYNEAWKYLTVEEDVEDIVYETLTQLIAHMEKFRALLPHERIQYTRAVIRNLSYNHLKRASRFADFPFEDIDSYLTVEDSKLPDQVVFQKIQLEKIRKIWAEMPVEDRLLLEQKYVLDWTDKELASKLGIQPQSVRMRLTRAKRKVIQLMKEQGFQISEWL